MAPFHLRPVGVEVECFMLFLLLYLLRFQVWIFSQSIRISFFLPGCDPSHKLPCNSVLQHALTTQFALLLCYNLLQSLDPESVDTKGNYIYFFGRKNIYSHCSQIMIMTIMTNIVYLSSPCISSKQLCSFFLLLTTSNNVNVSDLINFYLFLLFIQIILLLDQWLVTHLSLERLFLFVGLSVQWKVHCKVGQNLSPYGKRI